MDRIPCLAQGKRFFFEKKNQKTFAHEGFLLGQRMHQIVKVFASFFKKKRFLADPASGSHVWL
jgi:hypothetical protein